MDRSPGRTWAAISLTGRQTMSCSTRFAKETDMARGDRPLPFEQLEPYMRGAKFAAVALSRRHAEHDPDLADDAARYVKMAATVDHISNGRLEVGLGAGWYEPEHEMFGIPFPETKELVARFREAVQVIDLVMREDTSSFAGEYYQLKNAQSRPLGVQKPRAPLVIGAFGPRMLKIVAKYADTWNAFGTPAEMRERNQMLDDYCREIGRDPE